MPDTESSLPSYLNGMTSTDAGWMCSCHDENMCGHADASFDAMHRIIQQLRGELVALLDAHQELIESEFGTGRPDPRFDEKWPEIRKAQEAINEVPEVAHFQCGRVEVDGRAEHEPTSCDLISHMRPVVEQSLRLRERYGTAEGKAWEQRELQLFCIAVDMYREALYD